MIMRALSQVISWFKPKPWYDKFDDLNYYELYGDFIGPPEQIWCECCFCRAPIPVYWTNGVLRGNYILLADQVAHLGCFDVLHVEMNERVNPE